MKKIINISKEKLVFPKFDLVMRPNEIIEISKLLARELLENNNIKEVLPALLKKKSKIKKRIRNNKKGRKKLKK